MSTESRTGRKNFTRREWRPLAVPAQALCWVLIALMGLPPTALACVFNTCPTSGGGPGGGGKGNGSAASGSGVAKGSSRAPKGGKSDPINLGRMSTYMWDTDVETAIVPGGQKDAALRFTRFQSSDDQTLTNTAVAANGPLGWRWTHNYNLQLRTNGIGVKIKTEDASVETFTFDGISYNTTAAGDTRLYKSGTNFIWQMRNGTKYTFDGTNNYRLLTIVDPQTNKLTLTYNASSLLTNVADQLGRNLRFTYNASNLIAQVIDPLARTNSYFYDDSGQLTNVVDALGAKDVYAYDGPGSGRVTTITNPRGKTHTYVYDAVGKVISETNALGVVMDFARDDVAHTVTTTDRNGNSYTDTFNVDSKQTERTDAAGTMTLLRDDKNRPTNIINRLGYLTQNFYAENGCGCQIAGGLIMSIDPLNRTNRWDTGDQNLTLMEAMERSKIIEVLKETGGNKLETAKRLGIGRQTLYNKIRNYQIAA